MGLKYIEPAKTIVLFLLVIMSVTLTLSIWTYPKSFETNEQATTVNISIAEKRTIEDVIKPYKVLFNFEEGLRGSNSTNEIDQIIDVMKGMTITNVSLADINYNQDKLDALMRKQNGFTFYFHGEVPFRVYDDVLDIEETVPEATFDRLVVEWNQGNAALDVHFISRTNKVRYSAKVKGYDSQSFNRSVVLKAFSYDEYKEIGPESPKFIAVPTKPVETIRSTYYYEEISPSSFRDALFNDPNAVNRNQAGQNIEEFTDDHALMTINTSLKTLNYVHPVAEGDEIAIPSTLLTNSLEFVNEHDGWTDDFRYMHMNPLSRYVKFQLHFQGLPVIGDMASTEITQIWGDSKIFRYMRPYYMIDSTFHSEQENIQLSSGIEVVEMLMTSETIDFSAVDEITPGYYLKRDKEENLFTMEPTWFYLMKGYWNRYSPEQLGGN